MDRITLTAPAKINLSLRILGRRLDGFHELDTVMAPLTIADTLEIAHASGQGISLTCNDPEIPDGEGNLCVKAARLFQEETGIHHGISITLMKRIPHGAGLGGGSSDAAAVLRGLNELFDDPLVPEELMLLGARLGSDVPFFFHGGPALCRGRGEMLEKAPVHPPRRILLVKPPFSVSTAWAYGEYARLKEAGLLSSSTPLRSLGDISVINDLEEPVFRKYLLLPVLHKAMEEHSGVECAFMSGSGSAMVAVLAQAISIQEIANLKERIIAEFGQSMWITESAFL